MITVWKNYCVARNNICFGFPWSVLVRRRKDGRSQSPFLFLGWFLSSCLATSSLTHVDLAASLTKRQSCEQTRPLNRLKRALYPREGAVQEGRYLYSLKNLELGCCKKDVSCHFSLKETQGTAMKEGPLDII